MPHSLEHISNQNSESTDQDIYGDILNQLNSQPSFTERNVDLDGPTFPIGSTVIGEELGTPDVTDFLSSFDPRYQWLADILDQYLTYVGGPEFTGQSDEREYMPEEVQEIRDLLAAINSGEEIDLDSIRNDYPLLADYIGTQYEEPDVAWDVGGTGTVEGTLNEEGDFVFDPADVGIVVGDYTVDAGEAGGGGGGGAEEADTAAPVEEEVSEEELMGAEDPFGDTTDDGDDIVERQLIEAILNETDPEVRDRLIVEYEKYTGKTWNEEEAEETLGTEIPEREPTGYVWSGGLGDTEGGWIPVYGPYTPGQTEIYSEGSTAPEQPPEQPTEQPPEEEEDVVDLDVITPTDTTVDLEDTTTTAPETDTGTSTEPSTETTGTETGGDTGTGTGEGGGDGSGTGTGTGTGFGTGIGGGTGEGTGDGDGRGEGDGERVVEKQGMMSPQPFEKFMAGISYQAPSIQPLIQNRQTDYVASLNDLINRNSGMFG